MSLRSSVDNVVQFTASDTYTACGYLLNSKTRKNDKRINFVVIVGYLLQLKLKIVKDNNIS